MNGTTLGGRSSKFRGAEHQTPGLSGFRDLRLIKRAVNFEWDFDVPGRFRQW